MALVISADDQQIVILKLNGKSQRYWHHRNWPARNYHTAAGQPFGPGDLVVSCVEPADVTCPGATWHWVADLVNIIDASRCAAIKAGRWLNADGAHDSLLDQHRQGFE
jgi:hypothetical protein